MRSGTTLVCSPCRRSGEAAHRRAAWLRDQHHGLEHRGGGPRARALGDRDGVRAQPDVPLFTIAASASVLALIIMQVLSPKLETVKLGRG
jgi:hypothetical protein